MTSGNRVAIVGAGIAGLACAKVLIQEGFPVEVFDRSPDVGGVWSATRRYPGLRPHSSKRTYHFSDFPMPADYPAVPDAEQMQSYLEAYADHFGVREHLSLGTEVVAADPVDSGWLLEVRDESGSRRSSCDHLVIANGVYSDPVVPEYRGLDLFEAAGGRLGHSSRFQDLSAVRGKSVVVVGYGGSACDIAEAVSEVAASTHVVARELHWKVPRNNAKVLDFERLLLTRLGEAHFPHREPRWLDRFLTGPGSSFRASNLDLLRERTTRRLGLRELDLVPEGPIEEFADSSVGLASEGFFARVAEKRISVHRDTTIAELGGGRGAKPAVRLADGTTIQADIVICATGFQQRVPFLTPYIQRRLTDDDGNFLLYRQILPLDVPNLSFAGYNSSAISTLSAEVGAHWTAALLAGSLPLPAAEELRERTESTLVWMGERSTGRHAHGTAVTPFSLRTIDELLADMKYRLPLHVRAAQWFGAAKPGSYRGFTERRKSTGGAGSGANAASSASTAPPQSHPLPQQNVSTPSQQPVDQGHPVPQNDPRALASGAPLPAPDTTELRSYPPTRQSDQSVQAEREQVDPVPTEVSDSPGPDHTSPESSLPVAADSDQVPAAGNEPGAVHPEQTQPELMQQESELARQESR